jgi:hypothetical protein
VKGGAFKKNGALCTSLRNLEGSVYVCNDTTAVIKEYINKKHYDTKYSTKYDALEGHFRSDELTELQAKLCHQQSVFCNRNQ